VLSVDVDDGELEDEEIDSEVDFLEENESEEIEEEEEADDDEEDSNDDEEESESEETTPARKKIRLHIEPPEDYMSHAFYERGLFALSSIVAFKVKSKSPEYTDTSHQKLPSNYPIWIEHYSSRGMSPPTAQLVDFVKLMDRNFHNIHGESILKEKGLVKLFTNHMHVMAPEIPKNIVSVFAKLRILVRVRALNKRNRNKKKEDAARAKHDKNSRQANVNRVWESSKR
jgi:hypothetical protein